MRKAQPGFLNSKTLTRVFATAAFSLFFLLTNAAQAGLKNLERVTVSGSDYVRIVEWAESSGLSMKWNRKDSEIYLSGSAEPVEFTIDSRRVAVGGITVWLSLPVVNRSGVAMVSLTDLRTTLEPVLFPRKSEARVKTICLDPGHGGKDAGKADHHNYEKEYTLLLARQVESMLKEDGFNVVLTRNRDEFIELPDRPLLAEHHGADLFVSMHYNAADAGIARRGGLLFDAGGDEFQRRGWGKGVSIGGRWQRAG